MDCWSGRSSWHNLSELQNERNCAIYRFRKTGPTFLDSYNRLVNKCFWQKKITKVCFSYIFGFPLSFQYFYPVSVGTFNSMEGCSWFRCSWFRSSCKYWPASYLYRSANGPAFPQLQTLKIGRSADSTLFRNQVRQIFKLKSCEMVGRDEIFGWNVAKLWQRPFSP